MAQAQMGQDALSALGTPGVRYPAQNQMGLAIALLIGCMVLAGVFFAGYLDAVNDRFRDSNSETLFLVFAIGSVVAGVALMYGIGFHNRGLYVQVYSNGLARVKGSKVEALRWDEVRSIWQSITHYQRYGRVVRSVYVYTLQTADGRKLKFSNEINGIAALGQTLQTEVNKRVFPQAMLTYQAGQPVQFGAFSISKEGINYGKKFLPWSEVEGAQVQSGFVTFKKQGKWFNWANVPAGSIPNLFVFLALIDNIVGLRRAR
ncbi:MAG: hypothetical protein HXY40_01005 [Chloroflexi bacterium]|nr:hypothetical protein [Chloroflexota bacterium]